MKRDDSNVVPFLYIWELQKLTDMRKFFILLFVALSCLVPEIMEARTDRVIKVLSIGNSFSEDAVEQHLHDLAKADGVKIIIGNLYIGGCSLERHLNNAQNDHPQYKYRKIGLDGKKVEIKNVTLAHGLADEEWDYVSFQQQSGRSGMYESWEASLPALIEYVKARIPKKATLALHQTWAYDATSNHKDFKNYDHDQKKMYTSIVDAVNKTSKLTGVKLVIPCGTAIQNARTTSLNEVVTRDGYHLHKTYGRYIAACTWYEKVCGKSAVGNPYKPQKMTEEQQKLAQKSAHAAVRKAKKVTKIK